MELCLHGGSSYGRRLTILDPASKEVNELQQLLDRELAEATDDSADSVNQLWNEAQAAPQNVDSNGTTIRSIPNENIECTSNSDDIGEFFTPLSQPQSVQSPCQFKSPCQFNGSGNMLVDDIGSGAVTSTRCHAVVDSSKESGQKRTAAISDEVAVKRIRHDVSAGLENDVGPLGKEKVSGSDNDVAVREEIRLSSSENTVAQCCSENTVAQCEDEILFSSENDLVVNAQIESAENEAAPVVMLHPPSSLGFTRDRCMLNTATGMPSFILFLFILNFFRLLNPKGTMLTTDNTV